MSQTLKWPDGRGRYVDHNSSRVDAVDSVDDVPLTVQPGGTVDVSDSDVADHLRSRGFVDADGGSDGDADGDTDADGSDADTGDGESTDGGDFDAEAFVDRTPVSDVVDDIEAGDADGHLDEVADIDDRVTVQDAVESRKDAIGGD